MVKSIKGGRKPTGVVFLKFARPHPPQFHFFKDYKSKFIGFFDKTMNGQFKIIKNPFLYFRLKDETRDLRSELKVLNPQFVSSFYNLFSKKLYIV